MDPNRLLFSRGSTPPGSQSQHQSYSSQPPSQIDSLFHNLTSSSSDQQTSSNQGSSYNANPEPPTPTMSLIDEPSTSSVSTNTATERQRSLLSLLGNSSGSNNRSGVPAPPVPQQIPTPPGSSQRSNASPTHNEVQGKLLLEQLMAGNPPRSNYSDSQRGSAPSPPYMSSSATSQREGDYHNREASYNPHDSADFTPRSQVQPQVQASQPLQQQQQSSSGSPRKSMFDFVSPFDVLSSGTSSVKKKPVPQTASASSSNEDTTSSWTTVSDPKRQSVENLLETLTRNQPPLPPAQAPTTSYEPYASGSDFSQPSTIQSRPAPPPPPPLPPKPDRTASPRLSPPKTQAANRPQVRPVESPAGQPGAPSSHAASANRRDKESSPAPRSTFRGKDATNQSAKNKTSPSPQPQSIVFDVSQNLDDIVAPRDAIYSTPIALVRQDPVFVLGTTIGATHWVAYAMTKGRVRVISRASGQRTLLQLPSTFPLTSSVTDMAVHGNRLAGVTSDGGFVIWELPEVVADDSPAELILTVPPAPRSDALYLVKWHPREPDTLAIASETKVYLIDLTNAHPYRGQSLLQAELHLIGQVFSVASRIVAINFDVSNFSVASISEDSTFTKWHFHDKVPYVNQKVIGEGVPSSLTFVEGGIIIGRKNGTIFQLVSNHNRNLFSTVKFINGSEEDPEMFGHANYDARIQTLWIANCRRDSFIAFRISVESVSHGAEESTRAYFEQVIEFVGPKPTIHFVILTEDLDPNGVEADTACQAAKIQSGELSLVAFAVHSSGVDQSLIRKEWWDSALISTAAKFPPYTLLQAPQTVGTGMEGKSRQPVQIAPITNSGPTGPLANAPPARLRTPPSEDVEGDIAREESRLPETKTKGTKGKNVNWKEKDDGRDREKNTKLNDSTILNESSLGQALSREIRKTEESLHTRIGRLIGKEMDKQHQRLEDARAHEQAEDFSRQEKILKLISTELTRNTTRVVEMAVKNEVQNSVLPSLENITKNEVKAALNDQVGRGLVDVINQSLPTEIEKLLLRPDISNHFAHILSSNLTPLIERNVKEAISKTFIPVYSQQSSLLKQELLREFHAELQAVKGELNAWQSEAYRSQGNAIRELEHSVRNLSEQLKILSISPPSASGSLHHLQQSHNSPGPSHNPQPMNQSHLRQQNIPPANQPTSYNQSHSNFQQQPQPTLHGPWFNQPGIAAPQASHPAALPQPPQPQPQPQVQPRAPSPTLTPAQWDTVFLEILHTEDATKLRDLLSQTSRDVILPMHGTPLVSQAVVITLVHRLSAVVGATLPTDESFKTSLRWLHRAVHVLNPADELITDFIPQITPNVQHSLNTTKQRIGILPGGIESVRTLSEIQDTLRRKVIPTS